LSQFFDFSTPGIVITVFGVLQQNFLQNFQVLDVDVAQSRKGDMMGLKGQENWEISVKFCPVIFFKTQKLTTMVSSSYFAQILCIIVSVDLHTSKSFFYSHSGG